MKYYGAIGFQEDNVEVRPGVFRSQIVDHMYRGDYNRVSYSYRSSEHLNDDITVSAEVSIVGDSHAFLNLNHIRYVTWRGTKWKVINIDDSKHPRIVLTIGGEWNDNRGSQS